MRVHLRKLLDILLLRCLRCDRGGVWKAPMLMRKQCPVCGWVFEREIGYFYGAMYTSWFFSFLTIFPVFFLLLLTGRPLWVVLTVTIGQTIVQVPLAFMYGRMLWMWLDNLLDPFPAWEREARGEAAG